MPDDNFVFVTDRPAKWQIGRLPIMFHAQDLIEVTVLPDELRFTATIHHTDGPHLLFSVEAQNAPLFNPGTNIQFLQAADGGLFLCESVVVNRRENMIVAKTGRPQLLQRRRAKRFTCNLAAYYGLNLSVVEVSNLDKSKLIPVRVSDLSLGGAQLSVSEILFAHARLGIRILLSDTEYIHAEASVVRCTKAGKKIDDVQSHDTNLVAVRFGCVPRFDQVQIHRFLTNFS